MAKLTIFGKIILACCGFLIVATIVRFVTGTMLATFPTIAVGLVVCFCLAIVHNERKSMLFEDQMILKHREMIKEHAMYSVCHPDIIACMTIFNDTSMTHKRRLIEGQSFMIDRGYDTELANSTTGFELLIRKKFAGDVFNYKIELPYG